MVSEYEKTSYVTGTYIKENYWVYVTEVKGSLEPDLLFVFPVAGGTSSGQEVREQAHVVTTVM